MLTYRVYARKHMERILSGELSAPALSHADALRVATEATGRAPALVRYLVSPLRLKERTYIAAGRGHTEGYIVERIS